MMRYVHFCSCFCLLLLFAIISAGCGEDASCAANERMFNGVCVCVYGYERVGGVCVPAGSVDGDEDLIDPESDGDDELEGGEGEEPEQSGPEPCDNEGETRMVSCGDNGNGIREQTCVDGIWENTGTCSDPDECRDGDLRDGNIPCGDDGYFYAEMCIGGRWGMSTQCLEHEYCLEGATRGSEVVCGVNDHGVTLDICEDGFWRGTDICIDAEVCENGTTQSLDCGYNGNGNMQLMCANGAWQVSIACIDPDMCCNGNRAASGESCGINNRGRLVRECVNGQYSDTEDCLDYDVCLDGEESTQPCGLNFRGQTVVACNEGHWGVVPPVECDNDPDDCVDGTAIETGESCGLNDRGVELRPCVGGHYSDTTLCRDPDSCTDDETRDSELGCGSGGDGHYTETCVNGGWIVGDACSEASGVSLVGNATALDALADTGTSSAKEFNGTMFFEVSDASMGREFYRTEGSAESTGLMCDQVLQYPQQETDRHHIFHWSDLYFTRNGRLWSYAQGADVPRACFPQCRHLAGGNSADCPVMREDDFMYVFEGAVWFTSPRGLCRIDDCDSRYVCFPGCGGGIYTPIGSDFNERLFMLYNGEAWMFQNNMMTRLAPELSGITGGFFADDVLMLWKQTGENTVRFFGVSPHGAQWEIPLNERMGMLAYLRDSATGGLWVVARDALWFTDGTVEGTVIKADLPDIASASMRIIGGKVVIDARYGFSTQGREHVLRGRFRYDKQSGELTYLEVPGDGTCPTLHTGGALYTACPGETILYRLDYDDPHSQPVMAFNNFVGFVDTLFEGEIYFKTVRGNDFVLWATNGTTEGTRMVSALQRMVTTEALAPDRLGMTPHNGQMYFARLEPEPPVEDEPPTYTLKVLHSNAAGNGYETWGECSGYSGDANSIDRLMVFDNAVWAVGPGGYTPVEDDTLCNTVPGEFVAEPVLINGLWYYLRKEVNTNRIVLSRSNGTGDGTFVISNWAAAANAGERFITGAGGHIYVTTETPDGLQLIKEVAADGSGISGIESLDNNMVTNPRPHWAVVDDSVFFNAEGKIYDDEAGAWTPLGYQLWRYDQDSGEAQYVPVNEGATLTWSLSEMDGDLYFLEAQQEPVSLYVMPGGEDPQMLQQGLYMYDRNRVNLIPCGDVVYVINKFDAAPTNNTGEFETPELWATDSNGAWPLLQTDFGAKFLNLSEAVCHDGKLYFNNYDYTHGMELWVSEGQGFNTRLYYDIAPGPASSYPHDFRVTGGRLFMVADDCVHGPELWKVE